MAQVALGLVLAVSAGLLTRTLRNLEQLNLGLKTDGLLVFGLSPRDDQSTLAFYNSVLERLRSLPHVIDVTMMGNRIGSGWSNNTTAWVDGQVPKGVNAFMRWNAVGADFFTTLGVPILQGRDFRPSDSGGAKVAIVNQTFVKQFFKNRQVLGRYVSFDSNTPYSIIGVAADSKYTSVRELPIPMAYFPFRQGSPLGGVHIEMRTVGDPVFISPGCPPHGCIHRSRSSSAATDDSTCPIRCEHFPRAPSLAIVAILWRLGNYLDRQRPLWNACL